MNALVLCLLIFAGSVAHTRGDSPELARVEAANIGKDQVKQQQANREAQTQPDARIMVSTPDKPQVGTEGVISSTKPYRWSELYAPAQMPNWFLVIVGGIAGFFAWKTLRAIERQANLMHNSLVTQYRPKITVSSIRLEPQDWEDYGLSRVKLAVIVRFFNEGGTEAQINEQRIEIAWIDQNQGKTAHVSVWFDAFVLKPAASREVTVPVNNESFGIAISRAHNALRTNIYQGRSPRCGGKFTYTDGNAIERSTGFLRRYSARHREFVVQNTQQEHAD